MIYKYDPSFMIYKYDPSLIDGLSFFYRGFKEKEMYLSIIDNKLYVDGSLLADLKNVNRIKCEKYDENLWYLMLLEKNKQISLVEFYFNYDISKFINRSIEMKKL